MYSGKVEHIELIQLMNKNSKQMRDAINEMHTRAKESAIAEKTYRTKLAVKKLELKDKGLPVTLIDDISKGDAEIADLRFQFHLATTLYDTAKEAIRSLRAEASVLQSILRIQYDKGE